MEVLTLFINASSWKTLFLTLLASSSLQQTFLELNLQMTKTEQNWRSLRPSRGWLRQRREEKFAKKHVMQSLFCTTKTMNTIYRVFRQKLDTFRRLQLGRWPSYHAGHHLIGCRTSRSFFWGAARQGPTSFDRAIAFFLKKSVFFANFYQTHLWYF